MPDSADPPPPGPGPPEHPEPSPPFPARLLGGGARGVRRAAQAAGIDRAVEAVAEEAIVRAVESAAVERALVRVLRGRAVEEAIEQTVNSPAVERALTEALDSELVDSLWRQLLASDEAQQLVERIAEAPEVRSAIAAQGVGFLDDIRRELARIARRLEDVAERIDRRLLFRRRRTEPTDCAGLITRGLAFALDVGILNAVFFAVSALVALIASAVFPGDATAPALAFGAAAWLVAGGFYLVVFWTLADQTPGMRFLGIRLANVDPDRPGVELRAAIARLFGLALAVIPLGLGLLGIVTSERRRGLQDRVARTEVRYEALARQPTRGA
jgi:uncharacterized RDD family membrane protein YckC